MPSDWSYWSSSTSSNWMYNATCQVIYQYVEDLLEEDEPKEKELGFFKE